MAEKITLADTTFLIPVRIDSVTRLENTLLVTNFLLSHFDTNIKILEAAGYNNHLLRKLLPADISHIFVEDPDSIFHRTKYINRLVKTCDTPYLAGWDADVLAPPKQIIQSVKRLRAGKVNFAYPYEKYCFDTTPILRELYAQTRDLELIRQHTGKMKKCITLNR